MWRHWYALQATVGDGLKAVAQLAQSLSSGSSADSESVSNDASTPAQPPEQQEQTGHSADSKFDQTPHGGKSWSSQQLDVLIVDAGSGDASVAMSCPPAAFLELEFLQHAKKVLKGKGMLVVNCVSRAAEPYKAAVKALQVDACLLMQSLSHANLAPIMQAMQNMRKPCTNNASVAMPVLSPKTATSIGCKVEMHGMHGKHGSVCHLSRVY